MDIIRGFRGNAFSLDIIVARQFPMKGPSDLFHTDSQHKNPLCRVTPLDSTDGYKIGKLDYDKEKYKEMMLDAAESIRIFWF